MAKIGGNKKIDEKKVIEQWYPTTEEKKKFFEFIDNYMTDCGESEFILFERPIKVKPHRGYKNRLQGKNQAMHDFGAITLSEYMGHPYIAVRAYSFTNDFIKTGATVRLYDKFEILEKLYFNHQYGLQKQLQFYDDASKQ